MIHDLYGLLNFVKGVPGGKAVLAVAADRLDSENSARGVRCGPSVGQQGIRAGFGLPALQRRSVDREKS